jgi:hypothetical protein
MQDDDRPFRSLEIPDQPTELELRLAEYDWSRPRPVAEPDVDEIRQALAALAVMDMEDDEDYDRYGSVWVH